MLNEHDLKDMQPTPTPVMRAKMVVTSVTPAPPGALNPSERLVFNAVGSGQAYAADGTGDEDNTFSRWTPCASLDMHVQNPALFGQFKPGDKLYVDFTPAD